jgi:flagellin-like protein
MIMEKRGLSSIVATMLLILITIILASIVFLWMRGITEEAITKFDGTNIKLICEEVQFDASYGNGTLYIMNTGNIPIYKMKVQSFGEGTHNTETIVGSWPSTGLNQGGTFSDTIITSNINKIILIPVLIGHSKKGDVAYTCEERFGHELLI